MYFVFFRIKIEANAAAAETKQRGPQVLSEGGRSQTNTVLGKHLVARKHCIEVITNLCQEIKYHRRCHIYHSPVLSSDLLVQPSSWEEEPALACIP